MPESFTSLRDGTVVPSGNAEQLLAKEERHSSMSIFRELKPSSPLGRRWLRRVGRSGRIRGSSTLRERYRF